ncbi:MAG: AraC family transcriptional regulator [Verrucomicrobiota bacterium]|jgi:PAS domain S-box-containing protein|nr:AraC family transcriptional regulator [Verrucomicrobiota bacterium]
MVIDSNQAEKRRTTLFKRISQETRFYHLFDCVPGLSFFAKDQDGVLLAANKHLVSLYGFESEKEFIGRTDFELLPRHLAEKYRRDDLAIMERREPATKIVELFLNRQGIPSWFRTSKYPIISDDDEVLGIMGIIQDYHHYREKFPDKQGINPALDYIHEQFREKISIADLAAMCQFSLRQFERKFKSTFNLSPQQYIIKMRIHEACELLCNGSKSIGDIAFTLGFYDQSSFTVQFKKTMNMTPLQYRKQLP